MFVIFCGFYLLNLFQSFLLKFKYVFLTGHHSFFMACLLSAVLGTSGMIGVELILCGGFLLGAWSAISPAIGQNYTNKVTDGDGVAMGHFGSLAYYIWSSTTTSISGNLCLPEIYFTGGATINGKLKPVSSKEEGLIKEVEVNLHKTCNNDTAVMNLYLSLDLLPTALQENTFVYELYII